MNTILTVEDSTDSYELIRRALGSSLKLEWAKTLGEAYRRLEKQRFDLVLLDVMLPDGDGFRLCSMLQTSDELKDIPVVFLTAKNATADKVLGFSVGAEDFISKPFDPTELKARVDAKLRRARQNKIRSRTLRIGDLEIDKDSQKVFMIENGESVEVEPTPIEFKLLLFLATRPGKVICRDEILNSIWGENIHVYGRSVDTHVSKLRKKLGQKADLIQSVHGSGYRFRIDEQSTPGLSVENYRGPAPFGQPLLKLDTPSVLP